jgi:hypothetical protein
MNGDERQLITGLFDRMRGFGPVQKDPDAEALIVDQVRSIPDAPYMLVQSVLVQEHALNQAAGRIEELEARVRELEAQSQAPAPAATQSGGFLGGVFGGGRSSVPQTGRSSAGFGQSSQGFGQRPGQPQPGMTGRPGGSPWGAQAAGQPGMQPQRAGGGFLQSAMATAAGVAGGMLLANSISSMLGGSSTAEAAPADAAPAAAEPAAAAAEAPADDAMMQDAGWDDAGGDFGGEFEL